MPRTRTLGAIVFEDFELLDLYGPLEMFGNIGPELAIVTVSQAAGAVRSAQGPQAVSEYAFNDAPALDFILLPGGYGTFEQAQNPAMLEFLQRHANAEVVMSVCSGSGVLAAAGLLDGRRATSNKLFFDAITQGSTNVTWERSARWVEDGNVFTSSGVSAGTDMSLGVIEKIYGTERARDIAVMTEYEWQADPDNDAFAAYINEGNMAEYLEVLGKA